MTDRRILVFLACVTASCAQPDVATPPPQSPAPAAAPAPAVAPAPAASSQPAAPAHLPTALDLMVAHATDLELRPEQLGRVKAIAKELDATNAPLEQSLA